MICKHWLQFTCWNALRVLRKQLLRKLLTVILQIPDETSLPCLSLHSFRAGKRNTCSCLGQTTSAMSGITITSSFTFKKPCTQGSSFIPNCSSNAGFYVRDVHPMPLHIWIVCKRSFQKPCWWDISSWMNSEDSVRATLVVRVRHDTQQTKSNKSRKAHYWPLKLRPSPEII